MCGSLTEGAEKTLSKIRVGYVAPTADNVLVAVAQKKDFFKKHGVEVELIAIRGGVQATQAILSNSIQFAQMAGSVVVRAVLSGGDVVMIAGFINRINYLLVSRPEITSAKDLLGKRVASASIGGSVDTILRLGLKGLGVDPASIIILSAGPPQSRLVLAARCEGKEVTTVEGLSRDGELDDLQRLFLKHGALKCGYCTPGMLIAAKGLLRRNPRPTLEKVKVGLDGNLCRCTGYTSIFEAILECSQASQWKGEA